MDSSTSNSDDSEAPHFDRVYEELRHLAQQRLAQGLGGASLQATGLVHEVWLKLSEAESMRELDSRHYFATAAQAMRWILVDRARRRRLIQPVDSNMIEIKASTGQEGDAAGQLLGLDAALDKFAERYPRQAAVVMHRHFAGLSVEETAEALQSSVATVKRDWRFAKAWLFEALEADQGSEQEKGENRDPGQAR